MKGTETLLFINLVFYVVFKHTTANFPFQYLSLKACGAINYQLYAKSKCYCILFCGAKVNILFKLSDLITHKKKFGCTQHPLWQPNIAVKQQERKPKIYSLHPTRILC